MDTKNLETAERSKRLAFIVNDDGIKPIRIVKKMANFVAIEVAGKYYQFLKPNAVVPQTRHAAQRLKEAINRFKKLEPN